MRQPIENLNTFDEFVDFLQTQRENVRYELYDGEVVQMRLPTGKHEEIITFLVMVLMSECIRLQLNYGIPSNTLVKPENKQSGYFPDILLLNRSNLLNEPRWKKESIITQRESIALIVEVVSQCVARVKNIEATDASAALATSGASPVTVSTNWRDDYHRKLADYEEMGVREYWIVDYPPFTSKLLIGNPTEPIITIYSLNDEGEYQGKHFKGNDPIESVTFPELNLTAQQIFLAQMS